jgi:hypothetical protein
MLRELYNIYNIKRYMYNIYKPYLYNIYNQYLYNICKPYLGQENAEARW